MRSVFVLIIFFSSFNAFSQFHKSPALYGTVCDTVLLGANFQFTVPINNQSADVQLDGTFFVDWGKDQFFGSIDFGSGTFSSLDRLHDFKGSHLSRFFYHNDRSIQLGYKVFWNSYRRRYRRRPVNFLLHYKRSAFEANSQWSKTNHYYEFRTFGAGAMTGVAQEGYYGKEWGIFTSVFFQWYQISEKWGSEITDIILTAQDEIKLNYLGLSLNLHAQFQELGAGISYTRPFRRENRLIGFSGVSHWGVFFSFYIDRENKTWSLIKYLF